MICFVLDFKKVFHSPYESSTRHFFHLFFYIVFVNSLTVAAIVSLYVKYSCNDIYLIDFHLKHS